MMIKGFNLDFMTGSENNACSEFRGGDYANGLDAGTSGAQSDNPNFENKK